MSSKKPPPLIPRQIREPCPVCGEISYSVAGVHPQCAVRQADEKRMNRVKRDPPAGIKVKPASGAKSWQRVCPKCKALQHVRKKVCSCGHAFANRARPAASEGDP